MAQARTVMSKLFNAIPGMAMPVSEVPQAMANLWDYEPMKGHEAPSEFRASQMNLIVHFGVETTEEEALSIFQAANSFAHRYPCRIIYLCPSDEQGGEELLTGKLYSECYIGKSRRDMRCCEALTLGYSLKDTRFLENQVSVWLESDLPTYYWVHRIDAERLNEFYPNLINDCRRLVYDSSVEGEQWKGRFGKGVVVRDLSHARLLPLRQTIGQLLSAFEPAVLVKELRAVCLRSCGRMQGEGRCLKTWVQHCLDLCYQATDSSKEQRLSVDFSVQPDPGKKWLELTFEYGSGKELIFRFNCLSGAASFHSSLGAEQVDYELKSRLMSPPDALSEALFFNE